MHPSEFLLVHNVRTDYGDLTELCHSIAMVGVQVPILYYRRDNLNVVKDGHRRLLCVDIVNLAHHLKEQGALTSAVLYGRIKELGWLDNAHINLINLKDVGLRIPITDVPAIEVPAPQDEADIAMFQLVSAKDGLRKPLNTIEEADAIHTLLGTMSGKEVAQLLGKSEAYVSRRHRLIALHPDFQQALIDGKLEPRAAEQLLSLSPEAAEDETLRKSLIAAKTYRQVGLKVRAANVVGEGAKGEAKAIDIDPLLLALREEAKIKAARATAALQELEAIYQKVDEKPDLSGVKEAMKWLK